MVCLRARKCVCENRKRERHTGRGRAHMQERQKERRTKERERDRHMKGDRACWYTRKAAQRVCIEGKRHTAQATPNSLANVCFHTLSLFGKSKKPLCVWPRAINTQVWVALFIFRLDIGLCIGLRIGIHLLSLQHLLHEFLYVCVWGGDVRREGGVSVWNLKGAQPLNPSSSSCSCSCSFCLYLTLCKRL